MKAKRLIILALLAVLVVSTVGCGGGGQEPTPITGYVTYNDEANGFSISYPEHWGNLVRFQTSEKTIVAFYDPKLGCSAPSGVNLVKEALPDSLSLREYFEAGKAMSADMDLGQTSIFEEQVTLGGRTAIKHVYILTGLDAKGMEVYLVEGSTGWVITCSTIRGFWDKYEPVFDTMLNSFRLLD